MKQQNKNPTAAGMNPKQNKFMKPGFSAGFVVTLVFSGAAFEAQSEVWPVLQAARISRWSSGSALSDAQICNNSAEPGAVVVAAGEIAQTLGVPARGQASATRTKNPEAPVAREGMALTATPHSKKAKAAAIKMPSVLFNQQPDGTQRVVQMAVSTNGVNADPNKMAATLGKYSDTRVPPEKLVELIQVAAKNVAWVSGGGVVGVVLS